MAPTRDEIIDQIKNRFASDDRVQALWLEGADAQKAVDQYSDIDLVLDVTDGHEQTVLSDLQQTLTVLGELDYAAEVTRPNAKLLHQVFHIRGTCEYLMLDVDIQSHSREFAFCYENSSEQPLVLFDKAQVIRFEHLDPNKLADEVSDQLTSIAATFAQRSRAVKYTKRGLFLEALAYYQKYVLAPLVQILRLQHAPLTSYNYLVHVSRDLPQHVVAEIEALYSVRSADEIRQKIAQAEQIYQLAWQQLEKQYGQ